MKVYNIETNYSIAEIFQVFSDEEGIIYLDSGKVDEVLGRYSMVMFKPFKEVVYKDHKTVWIERGIKQELEGDVFEIIRSLYEPYKVDKTHDYPFVGGLAGYLSYDLGRTIEDIPEESVDDMDIPDLHLNFYHGNILFDHGKRTMVYLDYDFDGKADERFSYIENKIEEATDVSIIDDKQFGMLPLPNMNKERYLEAIAQIKNYILEGDIYQANFTQRFMSNFNDNPIELYHKLRKLNPAPFASYLDLGDVQVLSSSPERFIEVRDGRMSTRPIKGTMPRGITPEEDIQNRIALENSEKDKSELLMIVDLERNDLGKVAEVGSVKVPELFKLETYATVFHLVSTIEAQLRSDKDIFDMIKATFPGGSITGAPKIRSMEIIESLEPTRRNIYTGSIGYIDFCGDLDLNIVIRTILVKDEKASFQVGGGIVWDSNPEMEYQETLHKGKALFEAMS